MKRLLKSPAVNAVCISVFTAFYAAVFFATSKSVAFHNSVSYEGGAAFLTAWKDFLAAGHQ